MLILSILLIGGVATGILWPLIQRQRAKATTALEVVTVPATTDIITSQHATEQLCPHCSMLNPANRTHCHECGNPLSARTLSALFDGIEKQEMMREFMQMGLLFLGMVIAMCVSNWLPVPGKLTILLLTFCVLVFRGWRQLSGD